MVNNFRPSKNSASVSVDAFTQTLRANKKTKKNSANQQAKKPRK
jgi:hypothetical protein